METNHGQEYDYNTFIGNLYEHPDVNPGDYVNLRFQAYSYNNSNNSRSLDAWVDNIRMGPRNYSGSAFEAIIHL